jgi:hypothetical protein
MVSRMPLKVGYDGFDFDTVELLLHVALVHFWDLIRCIQLGDNESLGCF